MLKALLFGAAVATMGTTALHAQSVNDARAVSRHRWDPEKLTGEVIKACGVTRTYFVVERDYDGFARLKESPSITADQHACATRVIKNWGIPIRN